MKLTTIKLCNFRSFYGKTPEIILAGEETRNTTIIHGNNGTGKTSLLNGFTWVLYDKFSAAFSSTEQLVNKRAVAEAEVGNFVECWVEVGWEHDDIRYRVKRECRGYKNETSFDVTRTQLYLQFAGSDGIWKFPTQQPEDIINQILPASLHQYFFFDGERIEEIVRSDKKAEIAEATKIFLGVEVINRSINHLKEAKKTLENELNAIGDSQVKKLLREQAKIEKEIESINQRQGEINQELEYQYIFKKETSNRLRELDESKILQERKQDLESQKLFQQSEFKKNKEALKKIISARGYTVLLSQITANYRQIIDDLKQRGELNSGVSKEFIEDILQSQRCICGAKLNQDGESYENVSKFLNKAGSSTLEETAIRMNAQVDEIDKQAREFWEEVDGEQVKINQLRQEISQIESELDVIQERLRQDRNEEISSLQKRLDNIEEKITELTLDKGRNEQQIENYQVEISELNKQIVKQKLNEQRQTLAQRRITATQDAIERLIELKLRQEKQFRLQLESRVQEIFSDISFTPYIPKISDKYELTLVEHTTGIEASVAASTGENQILSLSFIASIIDRVKEWNTRNNMLMVPESSTFPIVMDSPFGSLDAQYRRQIAKIIPQLANQLVVLVTKTQWRGEVEEEITARIGKEYVLTYYSSKPDCEEDYIDVGGETYPLVKQSPNGFEYTEIREVVI